jgi:hypothetical protein
LCDARNLFDLNRLEPLLPHEDYPNGSDSISPHSVPERLRIDSKRNWVALMFDYPSEEVGDGHAQLHPTRPSAHPAAEIHLGKFSRKVMAIEWTGPIPTEKEIRELADDLETAANATGIRAAQRFSYQMIGRVLREWASEIVQTIQTLPTPKAG